MSLSYFIKGAVIGFSIAAPVGPIGVLCIRRSLKDGAWAGLVSGMGAATADAAYGCVAGFGLTAISGFLIRHESILRILGGAFLCHLGLRTFFSKSKDETAREAGRGAFSTFGSTLLLTLANPATILSFAMVFSAFGLGGSINYAGAGILVAGVFFGSAIWWIVLSGSVGLLRTRLNSAWIRAINRASGTVLFGFGLYALSRLWAVIG